MIWDSGKPETGCGIGSTLEHTETVRAWLPGALERLGVQRLLDAPCGDRNWIKTIELPCAYVGVDNEPAHVEAAIKDGADIWLADVREDNLPKCDAILSRDFFQHISMADEQLVLENFRRTGAKYLIATCHGLAGHDVETGTNSFRYVDMRSVWGEPIDSVEDGADGRILGVWRL